jgi:hypothetical protein
MRFKCASVIVSAFLALGAASTDGLAQQPARWVLLGCQQVGLQLDRDVIRVGGQRGSFRAIRLLTAGSNVHLMDLKVVYGNGAPDDIPVRALIPAGQMTRPLDLRGTDRMIDRIEMIYQAIAGGHAIVCAEGLAVAAAAPPVAAPPPSRGWVGLGCQRVGFGVDRDVIRVGAQRGGFRAIRLKVAGNAINMLDLKVVYANGAPDDIPVRAVIPAGGQTGPLDLRGRERAIARIEMIYRSLPNLRGEATVCVEGLD